MRRKEKESQEVGKKMKMKKTETAVDRKREIAGGKEMPVIPTGLEERKVEKGYRLVIVLLTLAPRDQWVCQQSN